MTEYYAGYVSWCDQNRERALAERLFGMELKKLRVQRVRLQAGGHRTYHYQFNTPEVTAALNKYRELV